MDINNLLPFNNRVERIWKLSWIDFKQRYYNNVLGLFWALLNPLFKLCIYYTIFTMVFKPNIESYGLYLFLGLILWMFFSEGTNKSFAILKKRKYLIESIQFNKLDLFYASTLSVIYGFTFNLFAYLIISLLTGVIPTAKILWLPYFILVMGILILGVGLILSSINIFISDLNEIWTLVLLAGFWVTPIMYGTEKLYEKLPFLLYFNPIAGIIINARETILYGNSPDYFLLLHSFLYASFSLLIGLFLFNKYSHFAFEKL